MEMDTIMKPMTASRTLLKKRLSTVEIKQKLIEKANAKLMKKYFGQNKVVGKSVAKLVKLFTTYLVSMAIVFGRTTRN